VDQSSDAQQRLSQIQTLWSVVCRAGGEGPTTVVNAAQKQLLERYNKVVYRYLLGALRDADAAEDLAQEFALRFVQGNLQGADQKRGRFRDFLKGVLFHLIGDHHRRRKKSPLPLAAEFEPAAASSETAPSDREFTESWRSELLSGAWKSLAQLEEQSGHAYHTILHFRAERPDLRSEEMAEELSLKLGKPLTSAGVRQTLHRAREKFAEMLVGEVTQTLVDPTFADLEQELIDVGLHEYCRPALDKLRGDERGRPVN
jgi:RNA polymerase sigma-70 factor (ECF subfamily)